jgi:hypothetical protein
MLLRLSVTQPLLASSYNSLGYNKKNIVIKLTKLFAFPLFGVDLALDFFSRQVDVIGSNILLHVYSLMYSVFILRQAPSCCRLWRTSLRRRQRAVHTFFVRQQLCCNPYNGYNVSPTLCYFIEQDLSPY